MTTSSLKHTLVVLGLATAIHLDWHVARPGHHLSLGWPAHWLLSIPVFALLAWYVHRAWPDHPLSPSVLMIGLAGFLAAVVEPVWEIWTGAPIAWAFGAERLRAFALFAGLGAVTQVVILVLLRARVAKMAAEP